MAPLGRRKARLALGALERGSLVKGITLSKEQEKASAEGSLARAQNKPRNVNPYRVFGARAIVEETGERKVNPHQHPILSAFWLSGWYQAGGALMATLVASGMLTLEQLQGQESENDDNESEA